MRMPFASKASLIWTAILSILLLTACEPNGGTTGGEVSVERVGQRLSLPAESVKYDPPIDISFVREIGEEMNGLIRAVPGETLEHNRWTRLYEEALGIRIRYKWTANGDLYHQKLGVALASGNLPDVVRVDAQQLRQLSNAGLIQDLSEFYEKYAAPFTKEILSQEGSGPFESATIGGKLMGIPDTGASIENAQFLWIRTDWLERLSLEPPRTISDVLAISKAFTEDDPDGNGIRDTYGLAVAQHLWDPVMGLGGFMAAYGAYPNMWIEDESGRLVYGAVRPEVKTALKVLQDMYQSGQIDSEFVFKNGDKVDDDIAAGKFGMLYGQQWASFVVQSSHERDPSADWKAFPIVSSTNEPVRVPLPFATTQFYAVRKGYEHPEALVKLFNLHLEKNWGQTAEYETYYSTPFPVWKFSPVTPFPALKNLEAYRQLDEARRTGDTSVLKDEARAIMKNIEGYLTRNDIHGWGWQRTYGEDGAFAILDRYEKNGQLLYEPFGARRQR
ncbi:hypothetical protein PACILC2_30710 [Paenibacillus cisolokensis]|uniref:ABC transporter substrate-binding protein n=1 Tax=Paenibacillus cisolokensis TaxID=1658519 RepID=A0ABQ4N978_9BACL|nr:hypothetical protein PACILC2_30710 [Paenibacillus cisolokensis]